MICPKCKGEGKIFDPMSLMLTIGLPVALMIDADMTKKDCPVCDGSGFIGGGVGDCHSFPKHTRNVEQYLCPA